MKFEYKTDLSIEECRSSLKKELKLFHATMFKDGFRGFVIGKYFSISYSKSDRSKILNGLKKLSGTIYSRDGVTYVSLRIKKTYADIVTTPLMILFGVVFGYFVGVGFANAFICMILVLLLAFLTDCIYDRTKAATKENLLLLEFVSQAIQLKNPL